MRTAALLPPREICNKRERDESNFLQRSNRFINVAPLLLFLSHNLIVSARAAFFWKFLPPKLPRCRNKSWELLLSGWRRQTQKIEHVSFCESYFWARALLLCVYFSVVRRANYQPPAGLIYQRVMDTNLMWNSSHGCNETETETHSKRHLRLKYYMCASDEEKIRSHVARFFCLFHCSNNDLQNQIFSSLWCFYLDHS
jgi:hypothetical protein